MIILLLLAPFILLILFMLWPFVLYAGVAFVVGTMVSIFLDGYKITEYYGPISVLVMFVVYVFLLFLSDQFPKKTSLPPYDYEADKYTE